jgi:hypothetical protein
MQNTYELQADWIRRQYYRNLSLIDLMAKLYGESGFFFKGTLYAASTGLFFLVNINPIFLVVGAFINCLFITLGRHYQCLEHRLDDLLENIKTTERELHDLREQALSLFDKASESIERNLEKSSELEETRIELNKIQVKFNDSFKKAHDACTEIVGSFEQVSKVKEDFSSSVSDVVIKIQDLVAEADNVKKAMHRVEPKLEEFSQSEGRIDELLEKAKNMHGHFLEEYGERFAAFKQKNAKALNQQSLFFKVPDEADPQIYSELRC